MPDSMIENDILEQEKKSVEDIISIKPSPPITQCLNARAAALYA